jgi:alcohol dehydrogenase (cytochrome c)
LSPIVALGLVFNTLASVNNPKGSAVVEVRGDATPASAGAAAAAVETNAQALDAGSWPSYNRTLTSQRYSPLTQINTQTVRGLKVICSYDTHVREAFETGPLLIDGALIGTTAFDIFSIDPSNCRENWRTHDGYKSPTPLLVNRGAAYLEGRLFRGTLDGRVLAYDFKTGRQLWATTIANPRTGDLVDAAPIAWNGLVFIGSALGDVKGVKGRVYALAADSGRIVWETYVVPRPPSDPIRGPQGATPAAAALASWANAPDVPISGGGSWTSYTLNPATGRMCVPVGNPSPDFVKSLREGANLYTNTVLALDAKTGVYVNHFPVAPTDWHTWDVSNTPAIITTRGGKQLLSFAPKNGHLYGFDLATNQLLYRSPVTRMENEDVPLSTDKPIHFCPGASGGGEWNGEAYDPQNNLVLTGQSEWCTTVKLRTDAQVKAVATGEIWMGNVVINP